MKVYLDTKDLIGILQMANPCTAKQFAQYLLQNGHQLAVSSYTIMEISAPLHHPSSQVNVMKILNDLTQMPMAYVNADIRGLELREALDAFSSNREYQNISPFVKRFDEALDLSAEPGTQQFINYSLSEIVWDLYTHGGLQGLDCYAKEMKGYVAADRAIRKPPSLKGQFTKVVERNLRDDGLSCQGVSIKNFANWIYDNPNRCPSIRLSYEVWHEIVKNKGDRLADSDMEDYQHLICLPYVDLITLDRRMQHYVSQSAARIGMQCSCRILKSAKEVLNQIAGGN